MKWNFSFSPLLASKYIKSFILSACCCVSTLQGQEQPECKTFEELESSLWTDHVTLFSHLFKLTKVDSMLEFGVGNGTYYFLQNCPTVNSVDLVTSNNFEASEQNHHAYKELFSNFVNWDSSLYTCSEALNKAVGLAEKSINPSTIDSEYLDEISAMCEVLCSEREYDVAFVDGRIITRGDLVNALFGKVKIIVAHDVSFHPEMYGWSWIKVDPAYQEIRFSQGSRNSCVGT